MTKEGTVLDGKYEILKEIGRGGMSIVYLARDNRLNKQWAVKEMKNDGTKTRDTLLKGLEREANILKDVDHPVLPVHLLVALLMKRLHRRKGMKL